MSRVNQLALLLACLVICVTWTGHTHVSAQSSTGSEFCEIPDGAETEYSECYELLRDNQAGCEPCVCARQGMCQSVACPTTERCQCICVDPTLNDEDRTDQLPNISNLQIDTAFSEMAEAMKGINIELKANSSAIKKCFGKKGVLKKIGPVRTAAIRASAAASKVAEMVKDLNSLDDPALIKQIDAVIKAIETARSKHNALINSAAMAIASRSNTSLTDTSDPRETIKTLNGYTATGNCLRAKTIIVEWHPAYWYWNYYYKWSIYHRFWYYWFYCWYIRFTIYFKVWWWWIWRPWGWPWFWPWRWCQWWPWQWWGYIF